MSSNVVTCSACGTRNRVPGAAKGKPNCQHCKAALPWITAADDENFDAVADSSKVAVLLDLWAPWCGPCRQVGPVLEKFALEYAGRLKLVKVNVDNSPIIANRFQAQSIPLMLLFKDGQQVGRQLGAQPVPVLKKWLEANLPPA